MSGEWQPIETAPRDGTKVLILVPNLYSGPVVIVARWDADRYAARPVPRWESSDRLYGRADAKAHPPTHWMPLPTPPTDQPRRREG